MGALIEVNGDMSMSSSISVLKNFNQTIGVMITKKIFIYSRIFSSEES